MPEKPASDHHHFQLRMPGEFDSDARRKLCVTIVALATHAGGVARAEPPSCRRRRTQSAPARSCPPQRGRWPPSTPIRSARAWRRSTAAGDAGKRRRARAGAALPPRVRADRGGWCPRTRRTLAQASWRRSTLASRLSASEDQLFSLRCKSTVVSGRRDRTIRSPLHEISCFARYCTIP